MHAITIINQRYTGSIILRLGKPLSALLLTSSLMTPPVLHAQETDDQEETVIIIEEEDGETIESVEIEEIVVTGTHIRGANPTSRVIIIDEEDIKSSGYSTVDEYLRRLPQNSDNVNPGISTNVPGGVASRRIANNRASGINLRGLGEEATLILINGRRISAGAGGVGLAADVSSIPLGAVQRIEVLTDGASAVYGSDAVGGVVNIILKKNYQGFTIRGRYGNSSSGGDDYATDLTFGLNRDRFSALATVSYRKEKAVGTADYGITSSDFSDRGFGNQGATFAGFPAVVAPGDPLAGFINFPLTQRVTFAGTGPFTLADAIEDGEGNASGLPLNLGPESESYSATASLGYEIGDDTQVRATALFNRRDTATIGTPYIFSNVTLPDNYRFSPFKGADGSTPEEIQISYSTDQEVALGILPRERDSDRTTFMNFAVGLDHEFGDSGWRVSGDVNYSSDKLVTRYREVDDDALFDLQFNTDPAAAVNFFGDGTASGPALFNSFITPERRESQRSETWQGTLLLNGELFETTAGTWSIALGAEYLKENFRFQGFGLIDPETGRGNTESCLADPTLCADGSFADISDRRSYALFGELSVPVIGIEQNIPLVQELVVSAAAWYQNVRDTKTRDRISPSVGIRWTLSDEIALRANYNESFRTPSLLELTNATRVDFDGGIFDPIKSEFVPVDRLISGGNPDLDNETSKNFSVGGEFSFGPVTVDINYFENRFRNKIEDIFGNLEGEILANPNLFPDLISFNPDGSINSFRAVPINIGSLTLRGIDLSISADFELGNGDDIDLRVSAVDNFQYDQQAIAAVSAVQDLKGFDFGVQDFTMRLSAEYKSEHFSGIIAVNHDSDYRYDAADNDDVPLVATADSYTTLDAQLRYRFGEDGPLGNTSIAIGATNILDADPPFYGGNGLGVFFSNGVDPRRRVIYIDLSKEF